MCSRHLLYWASSMVSRSSGTIFFSNFCRLFNNDMVKQAKPCQYLKLINYIIECHIVGYWRLIFAGKPWISSFIRASLLISRKSICWGHSNTREDFFFKMEKCEVNKVWNEKLILWSWQLRVPSQGKNCKAGLIEFNREINHEVMQVQKQLSTRESG